MGKEGEQMKPSRETCLNTQSKFISSEGGKKHFFNRSIRLFFVSEVT